MHHFVRWFVGKFRDYNAKRFVVRNPDTIQTLIASSDIFLELSTALRFQSY